jgi:hypothetical protein
MTVFCGIDWAEGHHDVALIDEKGALAGKRRIQESPDGIGEFTELLAVAGDSAQEPIPVAIETPRGLRKVERRTGSRPPSPRRRSNLLAVNGGPMWTRLRPAGTGPGFTRR